MRLVLLVFALTLGSVYVDLRLGGVWDTHHLRLALPAMLLLALAWRWPGARSALPLPAGGGAGVGRAIATALCGGVLLTAVGTWGGWVGASGGVVLRAVLAVVSLALAVTAEEVIFRRSMPRWLAETPVLRGRHWVVGVLAAQLVFAVIHVPTDLLPHPQLPLTVLVTRAASRFAFGIVAAALAIWTGGLAVPALFHVALNVAVLELLAPFGFPVPDAARFVAALLAGGLLLFAGVLGMRRPPAATPEDVPSSRTRG